MSTEEVKGYEIGKVYKVKPEFIGKLGNGKGMYRGVEKGQGELQLKRPCYISTNCPSKVCDKMMLVLEHASELVCGFGKKGAIFEEVEG